MREGVNFALFSSHATRVELGIFDEVSGALEARHPLPGRTGDIWHGLLPPRKAGPGTLYAFFVDGPCDPGQGHRYDPKVPLMDPYARDLSHGPPPRSRVISRDFDWLGDRPPATTWRETVIYELHVKGFTQLHPAVPPAMRGKYLGLTVPAVIDYLKSLGVTAVELLPCQSFLSESFLTDRGLKNYWGYNPAALFAPARCYAVQDPVSEFKTMVKALHEAGIEVLLDVVFNHTAEGNESGPVLSFKGIDNALYYRLMADKRHYENVTGCGNTFNCEHPQVRSLVIDCLKYWVEDLHVDGFRFDLATVLARDGTGFNQNAPLFQLLRAEPSLAYVKLIAEPWDVGLGGYQLGRFPAGWSEWNDRYRDAVRAFWRGDGGRVGEFAERIAGSSDIFRHDGRKPTASINFVTAHDGFTLNDLVSYNERHNQANGENNADGTPNNFSWNCGVEGPTDDPAVGSRRKRYMRNLLATLLLSQGVPMIAAGDEFARTQQGNNNAYCQDNELSWIDWKLADSNADLIDFVRRLVRLRREHAEFRRDTFLKGTATRGAVKDVTWLHARGLEMTQDDWRDGALHCLGVLLGKRSGSPARLLLLVNAGDSAQPFTLPDTGPWICRFDTANSHRDAERTLTGTAYALAPGSAALLEC